MTKLLNVMIVDDDYLIRAHIKSLLNQKAEEFILIGEASNGYEALRLLKRLAPDIIISDIRMPQMDGITLQNKLAEAEFKGELIMLSNYDDFEYVKESLKKGALDYLLKHQLNELTLINALSKAREVYAKKRSSIVLRSSIATDLNILKSRLMNKILTGSYKHLEEAKQDIEALGLYMQLNRVVIIVFSITEGSTIGSEGVRDQSLIEFSILNIVTDILDENKNGFISQVEPKKYAVLLSLREVWSENSVYKSINSLMQKIAFCMKKYLNIGAKFSYSSIHHNLLSINKEYDMLVMQLEKQIYTEDKYVMNPIKSTDHDGLYGISLKEETRLIEFVESGKEEELRACMDEIFSELKTYTLLREDYTILVNELVGVLLRVCKRNESYLTKETREYVKNKLSKINTLEIVEKLQERLLDLYIYIANEIACDSMSAYSGHVKKTIKYIKENFKQDISLDTAAKDTNISSVYLSRLFKNEVGVGFSEYLQHYRLNKAKTLLLNKMNIKEAAMESGFRNYTYFLSLFKKKTGFTPTAYIQQGRTTD
ncbi:response regulator transcription factor [Vallitalea okinawensis]|uniref:response regulator transcription factor n=1 Tax=Vallitalea okinawensis TaxID=2078660 RepID=UPI000CFD14C6|nr:response regulator [Vallitalea okinawensis]